MVTFDISPIFRAAAGFDPAAPGYDILKTGDDEYRLSLAVPGFRRDELSIRTQEKVLTIVGERPVDPNHNAYVHRGIGLGNFERTFRLAEHVHVTGARLENGLLEVELERRVPEALRPRRIEIQEEAAHRPARLAQAEPAEPMHAEAAREQQPAEGEKAA